MNLIHTLDFGILIRDLTTEKPSGAGLQVPEIIIALQSSPLISGSYKAVDLRSSMSENFVAVMKW